MTKEELKQEAEVCIHNALYWLKLPISKENVEQGGSYILKLLEPREKRIAELEAQIEKMKCCSNCVYLAGCDLSGYEECKNFDKWELREIKEK